MLLSKNDKFQSWLWYEILELRQLYINANSFDFFYDIDLNSLERNDWTQLRKLHQKEEDISPQELSIFKSKNTYEVGKIILNAKYEADLKNSINEKPKRITMEELDWQIQMENYYSNHD